MTTPTTAPFASIRSSRDLSLVAFGAALLAACALSLGAFLPRVTSPAASADPIVAPQPAAVVVASR